jgi:hypothetical protein
MLSALGSDLFEFSDEMLVLFHAKFPELRVSDSAYRRFMFDEYASVNINAFNKLGSGKQNESISFMEYFSYCQILHGFESDTPTCALSYSPALSRRAFCCWCKVIVAVPRRA